MPIQDLVHDFQRSVSEIQTYIQNAFSVGGNGQYIFNKSFRDFVIESVVVKIYVAWESFLERCFENYVMKQPSVSGVVYMRYANPTDNDHARRMALGNQKFIEWGNPTIVLTLCGLYLDSGEPFQSIIAGINNDLINLRNVRNAAAHLSSTTQRSLEAAATKILGVPSPGITVSDLVLSKHPGSQTDETILDVYIKTLDAAVCAIAR